MAGHQGMVGSAIVRELQRQGYTNIISRTHKELDLTRQEAVEQFFAVERPEYVFLAAAKVGGIAANESALADFMYDNIIFEMNVVHAAWKSGCKKLEFLGSSCIYPRMAPQPMPESCLLTGVLEKTNEAYALAKISGLKYCEFLNLQYGTDYISVMPTNLYSPNDNYHHGIWSLPLLSLPGSSPKVLQVSAWIGCLGAVARCTSWLPLGAPRGTHWQGRCTMLARMELGAGK